jgi:molecular chaperone GrpE (heat shock protein)
MKPNYNNQSESAQSDEQQSGKEAQSGNMSPPPAASKRDAEEAEKAAQRAEKKAEQVHAEMAKEIDALQERVAFLEAVVDEVDKTFEQFTERVSTKGLGSSTLEYVSIIDEAEDDEDDIAGEE